MWQNGQGRAESSEQQREQVTLAPYMEFMSIVLGALAPLSSSLSLHKNPFPLSKPVMYGLEL